MCWLVGLSPEVLGQGTVTAVGSATRLGGWAQLTQAGRRPRKRALIASTSAKCFHLVSSLPSPRFTLGLMTAHTYPPLWANATITLRQFRGFDHETIVDNDGGPLHLSIGGTPMRVLTIFLGVFLALGGTLRAQLKELKPGFNLFSAQQDVQMGKEAAAEVEKSMPVVRNEELNAYLSKIGARLAKSKHAGTFPFSFAVINDKSINAFALPGGPVFVHTGLIAALDNESQLAGVLAHEMSHVALRHGTNQASKANLLQLGAALAISGLGEESMWSKLGQLGIGLGAQSVLLKYSRNAERDADLNGARIMNDVGYDPVQMARFFQKLEAQGQKDDSMLANFLSDHPTPGNRVAYVQEQNKYLPKNSYSETDPGSLPRVKNIVAGLPPPPPPKPAVPAAGSASPPDIRPSSQYKQFQGRAFSLSYPDNWQAFGEQGSDSLIVAPKEALLADAKGQTQIGYGFIASYYVPQNGKTDLRRDTDSLVRQLQQENPGMQRANTAQRTVRVSGQNGLVTALESNSPYRGEREADTLMTVARPEGLFYIIFIAPRSEQGSVQRTFDDVMRSVRF